MDDTSVVVAIEPNSGAYLAPTLGKANDAAYERYPDVWMHSVRTDDPTAELGLPTW